MPDRDEEQAQQQALERLDVGLELVAVLRVGQQHAGQERAQRHRQADHAA